MASQSDAERISETVSEIKRGRPEVFDPAYVKTIRAMFPDIRTTRGIVAKCYEIEAISALQADGKWIEGVSRIVGEQTYSATILEHLGRWRKENGMPADRVIKVARDLNKMLDDDPKMTTRDAVASLRVFREQSSQLRKGAGNGKAK